MDRTTADGPSEDELTALSASQRRLWFLDQYDGDDAYVIARATRFRGPLDLPALRAAHQLVADRHEILRTRYVVHMGTPMGAIDPPGPIDFSVEEVTDAPSDGHRSVGEFLAEATRTPFDLEVGPVWRIRVGRLASDDHIVVTAIHHIAADGWSFPVLRDEVSSSYRSIVAGEEPELPPLTTQYRHHAGGPTPGQESLEYWRRRFGDDPDPIPLPGDRSRPHRRSHRGDWVEVGPLQSDASRLREVANQTGASPFMVGLAIFAAFLGRVCRTDEVIVGIPHADRGATSAHGLIGPFVNTLPLRIELLPGASLVDQVATVRTEMLAALDHSAVPFEEIVKGVGPRRDPSHTPLFQVMYQMHDGAFRSKYDLPGLAETNVPVDGGSSKFDLIFEMNDAGGTVGGSLNFSSDIFDPDTGAVLARALAEMAEAALAQPEAALENLPLVDRWERHWLVSELNASQRDYPRTSSLWELFEAAVMGHPDVVAVAEGDESITYGRLHESALGVAARLREAGVGTGEPVGIEMQRSATMVATILAVAEVGGVYVPLDPAYPEVRRRRMLEASGARFVIRAHNDTVEVVATGLRDIVRLDSNPAYIMFTSGSTGRPKATVIPTHAVLRLVCNTDYVTVGPPDVIAHLSNTSFDAATFEIWGALLNGATLRVLDAGTIVDPDAFSEAMTRYRITTIFVTTALFNMVAGHRPDAFAPVRDVLFGGERCNVAAVASVLAAGPPQRLVHVYGPTESTTFASWHEISPDALTGGDLPQTIPIGGPVANTTLYVVDRAGELVPPGVVGELCIGGDGLAEGYLGEPELTAERFRPDPFGENPWGRLYHTGDLVRRRHDGEIEFVGRTDRQVKLRGFRVEPEEVERAIRSHEGVADALVAVISPQGDPKLVAWAVPVVGESLASSSILEHLRASLPPYTVPASVGVVAEIPIGPNGKVDLSQLPVPYEPRQDGVDVTDTSTSVMTEIFEQVLGVAGIRAGDSFFDLGGHSLLAVELISTVERRLGLRLPLASLFEDATPAGLARLVESGRSDEQDGLITFSDDGSSAPVFMFHHPSGTVLAYEPLARRIGTGQPVYGIQAQGIDGVGRPYETIEEMAEQYADRIEKAHPTGDCILVGHSLGGLLAWETARALRGRGRNVSMVALLDSRVPRHGWVEVDGELRRLTRLGRLRRHLRRLGADFFYGLRYASYSIRSAAVPPELARIRQIRSSSQAFEVYRPRPLDQRVVFFAARGSGSGEIPGARPSDEEWRDLTGSIEVVQVPGRHTGDDSLLNEPNVDVLAAELSSRIIGLSEDGESAPPAAAEAAIATDSTADGAMSPHALGSAARERGEASS